MNDRQTGHPIVELVKAAMWPFVVLIILILFYAPLNRTLQSLADRSDDIQTIKLGSLELNIRSRDLPTPSPDVAKTLVVMDGPLITELLSYRDSRGGPCFAVDETVDSRLPNFLKLAKLGLITLKKGVGNNICPNPYELSVTPLGQQTADFVLSIISAAISGKKAG
ncbi:MAG TPA: hypothetical protein VGO01_25745 [Bradyrhizobium sp.]|nr:hypothetical protein [Bradyrhizobium sp.]